MDQRILYNTKPRANDFHIHTSCRASISPSIFFLSNHLTYRFIRSSLFPLFPSVCFFYFSFPYHPSLSHRKQKLVKSHVSSQFRSSSRVPKRFTDLDKFRNPEKQLIYYNIIHIRTCVATTLYYTPEISIRKYSLYFATSLNNK